jgi:Ala-tRNA(Pro) deacylase
LSDFGRPQRRLLGSEGSVQSRSLDTFLRNARIPFTTFRHPQAFTAQEGAALSHVRGRSWGKVVVCVADGEMILAVLPAHRMVDLEALRTLADAATIRLALESEFTNAYPECELGAMPPFGALYSQRVFVDRSFVGETEMVFNAGTHTDALRMHYDDFADLSKPIVGSFTRPASTHGSVEAAASV